MNKTDIGNLLLEIGFISDGSSNGSLVFPSEIDHKIIWVDGINDLYETDITINCHNYMEYVEPKDFDSFLDNLDRLVLNGRDAWIYSNKNYFTWIEPSDDQRRKYFEKRMSMDTKPCKDALDSIEEHGMDHFKTFLDIEYEGRKIGSMSWDELADAFIKTKKLYEKN